MANIGGQAGSWVESRRVAPPGADLRTVALSGSELILGASEELADGWHWLTTGQRKELLLAKTRGGGVSVLEAACFPQVGEAKGPLPMSHRAAAPVGFSSDGTCETWAASRMLPHPYLGTSSAGGPNVAETPDGQARNAAWDSVLEPGAYDQAVLLQLRRAAVHGHQVLGIAS